MSELKDGSTVLEGYSYLGMGTVVVGPRPQPGVDLSFVKLSGSLLSTIATQAEWNSALMRSQVKLGTEGKMNSEQKSRFVATAVDCFSFLCSEYGLLFNIVGHEHIKFSNGNLDLSIYKEHASQTVFVDLYIVATNEMFTMHELLSALCPDDTRLAQCSGWTEESERNCLCSISNTFKRIAKGIIDLDRIVIEKVRATSTHLRNNLTLESQYGPLKQQANIAWDMGRRDVAIQLYSQCLPILSPLELRRASYYRPVQ